MPELVRQAETLIRWPKAFRLRIAPWTCITGFWNSTETADGLLTMEGTYIYGISVQIYLLRFEFNVRRMPKEYKNALE